MAFKLSLIHIYIDATRAQMGMVFQHFNLFPHLTVKKNITLAPVRLGRIDVYKRQLIDNSLYHNPR